MDKLVYTIENPSHLIFKRLFFKAFLVATEVYILVF